MTKIWATVLVLVGAVAGFSYYYFIGCETGVCRITSNPIASTLYGGLLGFVVAASFPNKSKEDDNKE